jgi:beta-glucosidase/6-phospho-beta-glucosidase/beta-galactosidase
VHLIDTSSDFRSGGAGSFRRAIRPSRNEESLSFHDRVLDDLERHDIEPLAGICHFETALAFARKSTAGSVGR